MSVGSEALANTENPLVRLPRGSLKFRGSATRCDGQKNCRQMSPLRSKVKLDCRLTPTRQQLLGERVSEPSCSCAGRLLPVRSPADARPLSAPQA